MKVRKAVTVDLCSFEQSTLYYPQGDDDEFSVGLRCPCGYASTIWIEVAGHMKEKASLAQVRDRVSDLLYAARDS